MTPKKKIKTIRPKTKKEKENGELSKKADIKESKKENKKDIKS